MSDTPLSSSSPDSVPSAGPGLPVGAGLVAQSLYVLRYLLSHSLTDSFRFLKSTEAPFVVQFAKYGFCGVIAVVVHNAAAWWFSRHTFPAFEGAPAETLKWNQIYANLCALPISNVVAYVTNAVWVFTGGRHGRGAEFLLFTLINVISGTAGIFAGPYLRDSLGTNWWVAQATLIVTSALVNFVCRKFLVFQK